jgi:hypothetical protein
MAEAGTCATKIVGSEMVKAVSFGISLHGIPDYVGFHSIILSSTVLRNSPEHLTFRYSRATEPSINQTFTPAWHRNCSQSSPLPEHIDDHPVVLPRLQLIQSQVHGFRASQTASEQQSDHCSISSPAKGALRNSIH